MRPLTSVSALVGVSQLWSRESLSRASASVLPMIGITPGRTVLIRRAAILRHAPLQIAIGTLRGRQLLDDGEHDVGRPRGQLEPGLRAAGLNDHRMALRATGHVDGTLHLEEPATMVERADLRRVDVDSGRLVRHDRAV